jgi:hypothetical protein
LTKFDQLNLVGEKELSDYPHIKERVPSTHFKDGQWLACVPSQPLPHQTKVNYKIGPELSSAEVTLEPIVDFNKV